MEVVVDGRQTGKTTLLINWAESENLYIVCPTRGMAMSVFKLAKKQGKKIHMPISWDEFIRKAYYAKGVKGFVIDELGLCLQQSSPVPIKCVTFSREV